MDAEKLKAAGKADVLERERTDVWEKSWILNALKGKGDAVPTERINMADQVMNVLK